MNFNQASIYVCPRSCNKVADCLASYGRYGVFTAASGSPYFWSQALAFVIEFVSGDLPRAVG